MQIGACVADLVLLVFYDEVHFNPKCMVLNKTWELKHLDLPMCFPNGTDFTKLKAVPPLLFCLSPHLRPSIQSAGTMRGRRSCAVTQTAAWRCGTSETPPNLSRSPSLTVRHAPWRHLNWNCENWGFTVKLTQPSGGIWTVCVMLGWNVIELTCYDGPREKKVIVQLHLIRYRNKQTNK